VESTFSHVFSSLRPTKLLFYLRAMEMFGFGAEQVLKGTGLTPKKLGNLNSLVETHQYVQVVANMMRLTQQPDLAFRLGRVLEPGDLGILGHTISAARDAAEAVKVWRCYSWLFFGSFFQASGYQRDGLLWYEYTPRATLLPHLLQFFIEEKIIVEVTLFQQFNAVRIPSRFYSVTYPAPAHASLYEDVLGVPVKFNADRYTFALDPSYNPRLPTGDRETFNLCMGYLQEMTRAVVNQTNLTTRTRYLIREQLPRVLSVEDIAEQTGMSVRTYCRKMGAENTSYQKLLAEVREETAKNYLVTTGLTSDEIAALLGFGDPGSLRRAFKTWTGVSIGDYKKQFATNA
jgi:AraC-like DNA-binding protein